MSMTASVTSYIYEWPTTKTKLRGHINHDCEMSHLNVKLISHFNASTTLRQNIIGRVYNCHAFDRINFHKILTWQQTFCCCSYVVRSLNLLPVVNSHSHFTRFLFLGDNFL